MAWPDRSDVYACNGESKTLGAWAEQLDMPFQALAHRLHLHGMELAMVVGIEPEPEPVAPPKVKRPRRAHIPAATQDRTTTAARSKPACRPAPIMASQMARKLTFRGETLSIKQWAKRIGISYGALRSRLVKGHSIEFALTAPRQKGGQQPRRKPVDCVHPATDTLHLPGVGSELCEDVGDRRGMVRSIDFEIGVFA